MKDWKIDIKLPDLALHTQLVLLTAFLAALWTFYGLRSGPDNGEFANTSVRCRKLESEWHEPHGISPGWCGPRQDKR